MLRHSLPIYLLLAFLTISAAHGQIGNTVTIPFVGVPSGSCGPLLYGLNTANGALYDCLSGSWNLVGGSGGGGTVTSVTGTANQIDVATGTTTPVLSIDPVFIAPGTLSAVTSIDATKLSGAIPSGITGVTQAVTDSSTKLATTAYVKTNVPVSVPWFSTPQGAANVSSMFTSTSNKMNVNSVVLPYPLATTQVTYEVGATADNTSATYDIGVATGTPSGTCTVVADIGPVAGTTFAPGANAYHSINWTQGTVNIPAGRIYLLTTTSQTVTPATVFGASVGGLLASPAAITISTGGTLPASFTCPADNNSGGGLNAGNIPWVSIH